MVFKVKPFRFTYHLKGQKGLFQFLVLGILSLGIQIQALNLNLEKNVPFSSLTGTPTTIAFKIYPSLVSTVPTAVQTFPLGTWEADYDFTHFKVAPNNNVRFKALFTNTSNLNPSDTYYYEIEVNGVVKGSREILQDEVWLLFKQEVVNNTTTLPVDCKCISTLPSNVFVKIADLGTFTKLSSHTLVELNMTGTLWSNSYTGTGISFELRIDNLPTTKGRASSLLRNQNHYDQSSATGVFPGLSAGNHTISLWAKSWYGGATQTCIDPGCFLTDQVLVKEYPGR